MIDNSIIEQIIEVSDCYEVIKDFLPLKKVGTNYVCLSPFTDERTPSFNVSPVKNLWKDYSSGKGGHAVSFLMQARGMNFPEAIKYLGKKYNIEITENRKPNNFELQKLKNKKSHLAVLEFSKKHFYKNLLNSETTKEYLKGRGFTPKIVKKFNLGYSLDSWNDLTNVAKLNKFSQIYLEEVDLAQCKNRRYFDKFRNRLMFPIQNIKHEVIGYGARILSDDKKQAKYLNSKESNIYQKSKVLYALNFAIPEIVKQDVCYITEGYTDVISFHQRGVINTVASCGTSLTVEQLKILKRYTHNIVLVFDGDRAGVDATHRSIDLAFQVGLNVSVIKLENVDPDEFAKTTNNLSDYLYENKMNFVNYKASFIDHSKIDEKSTKINDMIKSISLIDDAIKKEIYSIEISKLFDIKVDKVLTISKQQNKASKKLYKKSNTFSSNYLNDLLDIVKMNSNLSIKGISISNYIVLKIQELENGEILDFVVKYKTDKNLVVKETKESILIDEIDRIFKLIKIENVNTKLTNITNENLDYIQDLIYIKQNI